VDDEDEALPPAALEPLAELASGHEQLALGAFTEPLTLVSPILPWTLVCSGQPHAALGSEDDVEPPAAALPLAVDGEEVEELPEDMLPPDEEPDDGALPPAAALPEPVCDDWLVCAP
jgi:hypothetical protein